MARNEEDDFIGGSNRRPLSQKEFPTEDELGEDDWDDTEPCPECGKGIYEDSEWCPHCGTSLLERPWLGPRSKWVVGVLVVLVVVMTVMAVVAR